MRILIVEDEPKTAAYAQKGLSEHGFIVDIAANGVDGRYLALSSDYDLIVLDVMLPGVRSVLRRGAKQTSESLKVGDLEIEPRRRRVFRGDKKIDLTAKEFALLDYLVRNCGEVLSRTLIAEHVWDMNFDSDTNVVDVAMRRLRAKVDDPFEVKLIRTIRGVGYLLEGPAA